MSAKIICDVCGEVIESTDAVTVFRMWNFTCASTVTTEGLSHFAHDEDYYLCDRCFENMTDCFEELKVVDA